MNYNPLFLASPPMKSPAFQSDFRSFLQTSGIEKLSRLSSLGGWIPASYAPKGHFESGRFTPLCNSKRTLNSGSIIANFQNLSACRPIKILNSSSRICVTPLFDLKRPGQYIWQLHALLCGRTPAPSRSPRFVSARFAKVSSHSSGGIGNRGSRCRARSQLFCNSSIRRSLHVFTKCRAVSGR
jgi:hypothetical protein